MNKAFCSRLKLLVTVLSVALLSTGCTKGIVAAIWADNEYICTATDLVFHLEGSSAAQKGYVRVNDSDRVDAGYQFSGIESTWYWGGYGLGGDTVFHITRHQYKIKVSQTGEGIYFNRITNTKTMLKCKKS